MNAPLRHNWLEDAQALAAAALVGSFGRGLLKQSGLITGGTVGRAFLAHYGSGLSPGTLLLAINVALMAFAWFQVGRAFTIKAFSQSRCSRSPLACCRACPGLAYPYTNQYF